MLRKSKTPYIRDVYLAYLIDGARRTETDEFPIIEEWMVATEPPKEIIQWDRRCDVKDPSITAICFYCSDSGFQPILSNPQRYAEKMKQYQCVVGLDASPFDNMPLVVQKSQIYLNLGITYYYGLLGIKVIPNVRAGNDETLGMLDAIPRETLIAIGTNGFTWRKENRDIFRNQLNIIVDELRPLGIIVYGRVYDFIFDHVRELNVPIYQFDSHTNKRNKEAKSKKKLEGESHER